MMPMSLGFTRFGPVIKRRAMSTTMEASSGLEKELSTPPELDECCESRPAHSTKATGLAWSGQSKPTTVKTAACLWSLRV